MATPHTSESLDRLYVDLGYQPLSHQWGRLEIALGLLAAGIGLAGIVLHTPAFLQHPMLTETPVPEGTYFPYWLLTGSVLLFTLGGYLALAGHRRHLYESNDRLTAYLADLIRTQTGRTTSSAAAATSNGPTAAPAEHVVRPAGTPA